MAIKRKELKVGETYMSIHNDRVLKKVLYIGDVLILCLESKDMISTEVSYNIDRFLVNYRKLPKLKKRYWLWDMKATGGAAYKSSYYFDDDGYYSNGKTMYCNLGDMVKKHENEFIDIEVE